MINKRRSISRKSMRPIRCSVIPQNVLIMTGLGVTTRAGNNVGRQAILTGANIKVSQGVCELNTAILMIYLAGQAAFQISSGPFSAEALKVPQPVLAHVRVSNHKVISKSLRSPWMKPITEQLV